MFFVTRQYPFNLNCERQWVFTVEISTGQDGAGPDMFKPKYRDEGSPILDPHEAVQTALKIAALWKADMRAGKIKQGIILITAGSPGLTGIEADEALGKIALLAWADKKAAALPHCAFHGDIIDIADRDTIFIREEEEFYCCQNAYELAQEAWAKEIVEE